MKERYFLDTDGNEHWYIVPCARRDEWAAWVDLDEDNDDDAAVIAEGPPEWVFPIGGSPSQVTFEEPTL